MTRECAFHSSNRQLLVTDTRTGRTRWYGAPLGAPVEAVEAISDVDRAVVLLDYMARATPGAFQNLLCVDCDGSIVWRARLPTSLGDDAYVSFELVGDRLTANTWSCHRVSLDVQTGEIRDSTFTK